MSLYQIGHGEFVKHDQEIIRILIRAIGAMNFHNSTVNSLYKRQNDPEMLERFFHGLICDQFQTVIQK